MSPDTTKHRRPLRRLFDFLADPGAAAVGVTLAGALELLWQSWPRRSAAGAIPVMVTGFNAIQHFHDVPVKLLAVPGRGASGGCRRIPDPFPAVSSPAPRSRVPGSVARSGRPGELRVHLVNLVKVHMSYTPPEKKSLPLSAPAPACIPGLAALDVDAGDHASVLHPSAPAPARAAGDSPSFRGFPGRSRI